jgi:hypothetical protein
VPEHLALAATSRFIAIMSQQEIFYTVSLKIARGFMYFIKNKCGLCSQGGLFPRSAQSGKKYFF